MELQVQPNKWSCLPTAFAIVLDVPVATIFDWLGHTGDRIAWKHLDEPSCRRSFHPQEMFAFAFHRGYAVVTVEKEPDIKPNDFTKPCSIKSFWDLFFKDSVGVLVGTAQSGRRHAVAWDGSVILDPNGTRYDLNQFDPETFYSIHKIRSNQENCY